MDGRDRAKDKALQYSKWKNPKDSVRQAPRQSDPDPQFSQSDQAWVHQVSGDWRGKGNQPALPDLYKNLDSAVREEAERLVSSVGPDQGSPGRRPQRDDQGSPGRRPQRDDQGSPGRRPRREDGIEVDEDTVHNDMLTKGSRIGSVLDDQEEDDKPRYDRRTGERIRYRR